MLDKQREVCYNKAMTRRNEKVHVVTTEKRYTTKDGTEKTHHTHLLRHTYREGDKVNNRTVANISHLPIEAIDALRDVLNGKTLIPASSAFSITRSLPHGAACAIWEFARKIGLHKLLGPPSEMRNICLSLIISQIIKPQSKASFSSWWEDTTLGVDLNIANIHTDRIYEAMDWLYEKKDKIENELVRTHLEEGSFVLYDLSSSYVEGTHCPLASFGYSRDKKRGRRQIEYGVVATTEGMPLSMEVFPGNTSDPKSFIKAVSKLKDQFHLEKLVMVGDRGMITEARIDTLKSDTDFGWVSALRSVQIKQLVKDEAIQPTLFDEMDMAEITHPDYEAERLVCCRNPLLAEDRRRTRQELLQATEADLEKVAARVERGGLKDPAKIGLAAGRVLNRHKMAKHFDLDIKERSFSFSRREDSAALFQVISQR